jgi:hypothetical protein
MDLDRAAKFGTIGAVGVVLISVGTVGLGWVAWTDRIAGAEGMALGTVALVGIGGLAATILFLFVVVGAFVDRKLAARGLDGAGEDETGD